MVDVVQNIGRRVIRTLRRLGYLEAGMEVLVATGYDPLLDTEPELARTMAALDQVQGRLSVQTAHCLWRTRWRERAPHWLRVWL